MSGDDNVGHVASTADHWTLSVDRAEQPLLPNMNNAGNCNGNENRFTMLLDKWAIHKWPSDVRIKVQCFILRIWRRYSDGKLPKYLLNWQAALSMWTCQNSYQAFTAPRTRYSLHRYDAGESSVIHGMTDLRSAYLRTLQTVDKLKRMNACKWLGYQTFGKTDLILYCLFCDVVLSQ